jgi:hypothetical protein
VQAIRGLRAHLNLVQVTINNMQAASIPDRGDQPR